MIIDADGLFNGNRWRKCSSFARLNAPYLLLASNGFGRLEIDPARIIGKAYLTFNPRPTESQIMALLREYVEAHLLFLYQCDGQIWGQWDTPERLLARYRTAADLRSPAPPKELFDRWMSSYHSAESKNQQFTENFRNISKVSEGFETFLLGVGVGDGDGDGKNICAPQDGARDGSALNFDQKTNPSGHGKQAEALFEEWWSGYWRKRDRGHAVAAFKAHIKTQAQFEALMAAFKRDTPEMMARPIDKRPYGATYIRSLPWMDDVSASPVNKSKSAEEIAKELWN